MNGVISVVPTCFLPMLLALILVHGFVKKAPVYDFFVEGCREGIKSAIDITPYIIAVFVVIQIMTDSGALSLLESLCEPIFEPLGILEELISFMIMRPVSGSGMLAILENIADTYGADSFFVPLCFRDDGQQRDASLRYCRLFRGDARIKTVPYSGCGRGRLCGGNLAFYRAVLCDVKKGCNSPIS